jgi:putative Holliday junction resolvase
MRIMGLDIGDKYIGIAISDDQGIIAQPLKVIENTSQKDIIVALLELCSIYNISRIIFGLPKNMNGTIGSQAKKVINFIENIKQKIDIPCMPWDERLSTCGAQQILSNASVPIKKRKKIKDKIAAAIILQNYLDFCRSKRPDK